MSLLGLAQALLALCKILFVLQKNLSTGSHAFLVSSDCALAFAAALVANFCSRSTRKS